MIITMAKVRIIGPRGSAAPVLGALQDIGLLHLTTPALGEVEERLELEQRFQDRVRSILADVERALVGLGIKPAHTTPRELDPAKAARQARRVLREVDRLAHRRASLEEEAALLDKYGDLLAAFEALVIAEEKLDHTRAYYLMLNGKEGPDEPKLRHSLRQVLGDRFSLHVRPLPSGDLALVLLAPSVRADEIDRLLHEAGVREVDVGDQYGTTVGRALPRMRARRAEIKSELAELDLLLREVFASLRRSSCRDPADRNVSGGVPFLDPTTKDQGPRTARPALTSDPLVAALGPRYEPAPPSPWSSASSTAHSSAISVVIGSISSRCCSIGRRA